MSNQHFLPFCTNLYIFVVEPLPGSCMSGLCRQVGIVRCRGERFHTPIPIAPPNQVEVVGGEGRPFPLLCLQAQSSIETCPVFTRTSHHLYPKANLLPEAGQILWYRRVQPLCAVPQADSSLDMWPQEYLTNVKWFLRWCRPFSAPPLLLA